MRPRILAVLAAMALIAAVGVGPVLARSDTTVTETCTNGTITVYTTIDAAAVNIGNFAIASWNFAHNTPLGYVCSIS